MGLYFLIQLMNYVKKLFTHKLAFYFLLVILFVGFLAYTVPMIKEKHELNKIKHKIETEVQKIELNKQRRLNCSVNMELWNQENDESRAMITHLKEQYNNMVGFSQA